MAAKPLLYVHGAGPQQPAAAFKREADLILFGRDMPATRVAHYAGVRWPPAGAGPFAAAPSRAGRARRMAAIRGSMAPQVSPNAAAAAIIAATLTAPPPRGSAAAAPPPASAADVAAARRLVAQLYRRADRVASRSSVARPGVALGPTFPDAIFRFIVGQFASDAIDYLFGSWTEAMRAPVRQALLRSPRPKVIVAHSLGTVILYDVLSEPVFAGFRVDLLVTVSSPLGIGNIQKRLRDGAGRPNPVPKPIRAWSNFADRFDPVALDATLRDEFEPPKDFAVDESVNNPARNNHDLPGYLSVGIVRSTIADAVG
jgi:hypothetical protein